MDDGWTWQYCRGDYDITGDFYAEQDADEVRVWDGEFCLLAVVRDDGRWRIVASDFRLPDEVDDQTFRTPAAALDWLTAARGIDPKSVPEDTAGEDNDDTDGR